MTDKAFFWKGFRRYQSIGFQASKFRGRVWFLTSLFLCFTPVAMAADFNASTLGDFGNVTVMEVTGDYDAETPEGVINGTPRQAIARAFYETHEDVYDFLFIFTNFEYQMPQGKAIAFYNGVKNDIQGIGLPLFDDSILYGSEGRLQGTIDMGNVSDPASQLRNPNQVLLTLIHELLHRWGIAVRFQDDDGTVSSALLGQDGSHWSYLFDSGASVLYGHDWRDNGDGTFSAIAGEKAYGPLDLYLMGFYDKAEVPPMLLIENTEINPDQTPEVGVTIEGIARYVTIEDIIAAEGERIPSVAASQKTFKAAFIFAIHPGSLLGDSLYHIENIRNALLTRFSIFTDGRGLLEVASVVKEDLPRNPSFQPPVGNPRTTAGDLNDGIAWLMANQQSDGSWSDLQQTTDRDTTEAVRALKNFPIAQNHCGLGLDWVGSGVAGNTDYLARRILTLGDSQLDVGAAISELVQRQNDDGGWGTDIRYVSDPADTAFALQALLVGGYQNQGVLSNAVAYLTSHQNADGGWGTWDEASSILTTVHVLSAFNHLGTSHQLGKSIAGGLAWLVQKQNPDGGFGNSPSTVYDTALAILTLKELNVVSDIISNGVTYILDHQWDDGSWNDSAYQTALAVRAVSRAIVEPDLSVVPGDISFIPANLSTLPANTVVNALVRNLGKTDVPQATVALYAGTVSEETKIAAQNLAFPGQSETAVAFSVAVMDSNETRFYVVVDPEGAVNESNEQDNSAYQILAFEPTYDLNISSTAVTLSQGSVDAFEDVTIQADLSNQGTVDAYNVQVTYQVQTTDGLLLIGTNTVDILAGQTIHDDIIWRTNRAGENMPIIVSLDPLDAVSETWETNNQAETVITVHPVTEPNLTIAFEDITVTPNPAPQGGDVHIAAVVKNIGFSEASNFFVRFYHDDPGTGGALIGEQTVLSLAPGEVVGVSTDWTGIQELGEQIIHIQVDADNAVTEIREDDNDAFTTVVLLSRPDLIVSSNSIAFHPAAPKDGDIVSIELQIQNAGQQEAGNVVVEAYEGGTLLHSEIVPVISGNSQESVSFTYDTTGKTGAHEIRVVVDGENAIHEQSESNNRASRSFGVQDASLWLTEPYFSPNGDGVKDSTQIFFSLDEPATVQVAIVNEKGATVRLFAGPELKDLLSGNIEWDGLDDQGIVVDDGEYQIRLNDSENCELRRLLVFVDNNRSPLTDAIGTKYLTNKNITCGMEHDSNNVWQWLPDESAILYFVSHFANRSEYPTGFYTITPDGAEISRIVPQEWSYNHDPAYYYKFGANDSSQDIHLSPDGNKIAFVLRKHDKYSLKQVEVQLWVVETDGSNLTLLDSYDTTFTNASLGELTWSPNLEYIAYKVFSQSSHILSIVKIDDAQKVRAPGSGWEGISWSSDSSKVASVSAICGPNGACNEFELRITDLVGDSWTVYSSNNLIWPHGREWLNATNLMMVGQNYYEETDTLWLIDTSEQANHKKISDSYYELAVRPDKEGFAIIEDNEDGSAVTFVNGIGEPHLLRQKSFQNTYSRHLRELEWSHDGAKLAFFEAEASGSDALIIVDMQGRDSNKSLASENAVFYHLLQWFPDNRFLVARDGVGDYVIDFDDGEKAYLPFRVARSEGISPFGRYMTYNKAAEESSPCNNGYDDDLWTMSSLLNLTADLKVTKENTTVNLSGTAADLHFEGFRLEYADTADPANWESITPSSDVPVLDEHFAQWVPPRAGSYHVRLSVWDKAGNTRTITRGVSWGEYSSVTNLYTSDGLFSPNNDGIKDSTHLHYRVIAPIQLDFYVFKMSGDLIRTLHKEHAGPIEDSVTWDGRDEFGNMVPDGSYVIRVFDYEFSVQVDNTVPDVYAAVSLIQQDRDSQKTYAELSGRALDDNLKHWVVEYGIGVKPQEWYGYRNGEDVLVKRDDFGTPFLDPTENAILERYEWGQIGLLGDKRFRVTAEDFAGNKATCLSNVVEERIVFYLWDASKFVRLEGGGITDYLPAMHQISFLETVQEQIASITIQYNQDGQWHDAYNSNTDIDGLADIAWDTSQIDLRDGDSIRLKATDLGGQAHYSNQAMITVAPDDQDDYIPASVRFSLLVDNSVSDVCDPISGEATLSVSPPKWTGNISPQTLTYFIEDMSEYRTLEQFDLTIQGLGSVTVPTSGLPEGSYPVKAVFGYMDMTDQKWREVTAEATLIIDRVLPTARITYPASSSLICPTPLAEEPSQSYGVAVEGVVTDNDGVKRYELSYGIGENPQTWVVFDEGHRAIQGQVGLWEVDALQGTDYSVRLKAVDSTGNVSCSTTSFSIDTLTDVKNLAIDKALFSPNADGQFDEVTISYEIHEYSSVDVQVFALLDQANGPPVLGATLFRNILSAAQHLGGPGSAAWDGRNDSGSIVPDGKYGIVVSAIDACGNMSREWVVVKLDNTPPVAILAYPQASDSLGNIVEVCGTAADPNLQSYVLEVGEGSSPDVWTTVSSETHPATESVLGTWNTSGLSGVWTLKLSAADAVGNETETLTMVDLAAREDLIKSLGLAPSLFSPNGDTKGDATTITYELGDTCDLTIEFVDANGSVRKTDSVTAASAGLHTLVWDGKDGAGTVVPDGRYTVRIRAVLSSNAAVTQTEKVTADVDTSEPLIEITEPLENAFLSSDPTVFGTVSDSHLSEYNVSWTGASASDLLDQGTQSRTDYTFGTFREFAEGDYTLSVTAQDLAENSSSLSIPFTIDRTPPRVVLHAPANGAYYGSEKDTINLVGSIEEASLEAYSLRYGSGESPTEWVDLIAGGNVPVDSQLFTWHVGKYDGIPDGRYTVSLYARDKAGFESETTVSVTIDNTAPDASITAPSEGAYVKETASVTGTAFDVNLDKFEVEMAAGNCSSAFKWAAIETSGTSVQGGLLTTWRALPPDGDYCLRLTASDKLANSAEVMINVKVNTRGPAAPVLSGEIEESTDGHLNWTQNTEPDLAGYNLYRNNQKISTTLLSDISFVDTGLEEGVYIYVVKAVDHAGWESQPSNEVRLAADRTGPNVRISSPHNDGSVSGTVEIRGTAFSADDFKEYRVYMGQGADPATWTHLRSSPVPISYGPLAQWETLGTSDGEVYSVKLEAEDISGNVNADQITVTVDNVPPAAPILVSALANSSDVAITWETNTDQDLAGYLLYRDGWLVNVDGVVIGELKPYIIAGTTYLDASLPDGLFTYSLLAMDKAGNVSDPSNSIEVAIDGHPPQAIILEPQDKDRFEHTIAVKAESGDLDVASVQFEYKAAAETEWMQLGDPVTTVPTMTHLDPVTLPLTYGDYHLRAVATDTGGNTDPAPASITFTYADLTAPAVPVELSAFTNGGDVALSWTPNTETDLDGYHIYRTTGEVRTKINAAIVHDTTYLDPGVVDGTYDYKVTAVDVHGNESGPSNNAAVHIYAPVVEQPYSPTGEPTAQLHGANAEPDAVVEVFIDSGSGPESQGVIFADGEGNFIFDALLVLGENRITAQASDNAGNVSRISDAVVVVYNESPAAPTGLIASVTGDDVSLSWNPNSEPDIRGYCLYRDGERISDSVAVVVSEVSKISVSSTYSSYYSAQKAFDENPSTYWRSGHRYASTDPFWLEIELVSPEFIRRVEIDWTNVSYAGKDYEIQIASDQGWIPVAEITENNTLTNVVEFEAPLTTNKIRIFINSIVTTGDYAYVMISEIRITKDQLITETTWQDLDLSDGLYYYNVTAVDEYGFESLPSEGNQAGVGDVTPPAEPLNLAVSAVGSSMSLTWSGNTEADLAGYKLSRNVDGEWIEIAALPPMETSYLDGDLVNGVYSYRVTAFDFIGNESAPSNEASGTISIDLLEPPSGLHISPMPEGSMLRAEWTDPTGQAAGYFLYRSLTSGGPYAKVAEHALADSTYLDISLNNGVPYYYVVTAIDAVGNESAYSIEATGVPVDTEAPSKPKLSSDLPSGKCVAHYESTITLSGTAEPGSNLRVYKDGELYDEIAVRAEVEVRNTEFEDYFGRISMSRDSQTLAFVQNGSIWLMEISSESKSELIADADEPAFSEDASLLAYTFFDATNKKRLGVYNLKTEENVPLSDDVNNIIIGSSSYTSWSSYGLKISFFGFLDGAYSVWVYELDSGVLTRLTNTESAYKPQLSPDGTKVSFRAYPYLHVVDLLTNETIEVDNANYSAVYGWSRDSGRLAFVSYRSGSHDIFVWDAETDSVTQLTNSTESEETLVWSPGNDGLVFGRLEADGTRNLWFQSAENQDSPRLLLERIDYPNYLFWADTGQFSYLYGQALTLIYMAGSFDISDVVLGPGENRFHSVAVDASGNVSEPSDEICITLDNSLMPDVGTTVGDIFVYPPLPITGEEVAVDVAVWNRGQTEVEDLVVDLYLWDPTGNVELVKSEQVSYLAPGSGEYVGFAWDSSGRAGLNTVFVVVDALDTVAERDETNNIVYKDIFVSDTAGVALSTFLDADQYQGDQYVYITLALNNSGLDRDVSVETWIEDENGHWVAALDHINTTLYYGTSEEFSFAWNTGSILAGLYQVATILHDPPNLPQEAVNSFEILPNIAITSSLTTGMASYGPREVVGVDLSVSNEGDNYIVPALNARVIITGPEGNLVFSEEKLLQNMQPGADAAWRTSWNPGMQAPGVYDALLSVSLQDQSVSASSSQFVIEAVAEPIGQLILSPSVAALGDQVTITYTLENVGNTDVSGLPIDILIVDSDTLEVVDSHATDVDLPVGEVHSGQFTLATDHYQLKTYLAILQASLNGTTQTLATRSFTVRDGKAPFVQVISPLTGETYASDVGLSVTASDDASGVARVEYSLDGSGWRLMPSTGSASGLFGLTWSPSTVDEGERTFYFHAVDKAGNVSEPLTATITIISNSPPLAVDDSFNIEEDSILNIVSRGVLGNDSDPDGDDLTVKLGLQVNHGILSLKPDGSFTYTPEENWSGTDSFTYMANDGKLDSTVVTVTITVNPVNDAPLAKDNTYSTDEDQTLDVALPTILSNDSDVEGDSLTAILVNDVTHGTLTLHPDGSFAYAPAKNWFGRDGFTYMANDGPLDSNVATVAITVEPVNDPPVAVEDEGLSVDEDNTLTVAAPGLLCNDIDIDGNALSSVLVTDAINGTLSLNGDGSFTYLPDTDWYGTDTFTYRANDGNADSEAASVTITVNPVNDAPVAEDVTYGTDEDVALSVSVPGLLGHAMDAENDLLTVALVDSTVNGVVKLSSDGSFNYVPNPDWNGADTFSYKVKDGELNSKTAVVTLIVNPVNDPPWLSLVPDAQTIQYSDSIETVTVSASDFDSPSLTLATVGLPPHLSVAEEVCESVKSVLTCNWTINGQVLTAAAIHDIAVTVSDGELQADSQMTLTVEQESARVDFHDDNPVSVRVAQDGGTSGVFTLGAVAREVLPDLTNGLNAYPGDINLSNLSVSLIPVGPGASISPLSCSERVSGSAYEGGVDLNCTFDNVAVNTYALTVLIDGDFYQGTGEDVLVVYDPSLGFATGGGWFYWPSTNDLNTGYHGDKTNFGFTMNYRKNGSNVRGKLLLIRHLPDGSIYRVKSNALYGMALGVAEDANGLFGWASFGGKSTYLEPGWLDPIGNHEFVVYLEDHDEPGNGNDRFWVEVHDKDGGVIGDTSMERQAIEHTVELDGGNVVAPH